MLLLFTHRKSRKGFRLVPKLVTFNDFERPLLYVVSPISVQVGASYVTVIEVRPILFGKVL